MPHGAGADRAGGLYDLLPANRDLTAAEVRLLRSPTARNAPAGAPWRRSATNYDFILIDCPPSLNLLTAQRADRRRRRADPDAVRVLRAGRPVRPAGDGRAVARGGESAAGDRGPAAHHVRPAQQPRQRGLGAAHHALSATRCSAPSSRATCAWPRRPASASRSCCTTAARAARSPTSALAGEMIRRDDERPAAAERPPTSQSLQ